MKKNPPWFDAMMTRVAVQYPFYATILLGTPCHIIEPDEPIAEVITTAATDGSRPYSIPTQSKWLQRNLKWFTIGFIFFSLRF